jgi:catalase
MDGLTTIESKFEPKETMNRLEAELKARGMTIFARINHATLAEEAGLTLRPTEVILFGNPRGGTPLMQANQTIGIDLPLKALVWQDAAGKTWLSYNEPLWLARRHEIPETEPAVAATSRELHDIAAKVVSDMPVERRPDEPGGSAAGTKASDTTDAGVKSDVRKADEPTRPREITQAPIIGLPITSLVGRLVAIGIVVGGIAALFAYAGGWLNPHALTPKRIADTFETVNGVHSGFRRNHAKGVSVSGFFLSNGQGASLSKASVFHAGRVPIIGRFSLSGGKPYAADAATTVRGFGIRFQPADGEEWRTAMINFPVFPVKTPQAFEDQLLASAPDPVTGKPVPAKMEAFLAKYPESAKALQIIHGHPISSGFDNSTFNSLNAFRFIDGAGVVTWVRWSLVPVQPFEPIGAASSEHAGTNYLFDALIAGIHQHPLEWHLVVTVAAVGDPTDNATIPWPADRRQVDVGTLTIDKIESDDTSVARNINFDPLVLPDGMAASDDPLLSARSAVYSQSFTRREGEHKFANAVSPAETEK